jgi:hypothetical protein
VLKKTRLSDSGETICSEQNTIGERAGQLDFVFLLHSPTGWTAAFRFSGPGPDE